MHKGMLLRITVTIPGQSRDPGPKDNTGDEETWQARLFIGGKVVLHGWSVNGQQNSKVKYRQSRKKNTENKH